jgi:hypothetical protein
VEGNSERFSTAIAYQMKGYNAMVKFQYFNIIKESCATLDIYERYCKDYSFFIKYCLPQFNFSSQKFVLFANEFYSNYFHWHEQLLGLIALQENNLLKDNKILMPKKYRNFKFIVGTQFNVAWDSTLLVLDSVGNFGLPLKLDDHFGLVSKSKGVLSFQWFDESLKGITLPDKKSIFSLYFKVKGLRGLKSPITFVDGLSRNIC